jgi:hypothetical protein
MADRVLPKVSLIFPCSEAVYDLDPEWWTLSDPWTVVLYPPGVHGNFDVPGFAVYAHLTDGVGEFELHIEMRYLPEREQPVLVGRGSATRIEFPGGDQLLARDMVFEMRNVPFDRPGDYEFSIWANHVQLPGSAARMRVVDLGSPL